MYRSALVRSSMLSLLASPILLFGLHALFDRLTGQQAEPLLDYAVMSLILLIVLGVAAGGILLVALWLRWASGGLMDAVRFATVGAICSGGLITLVFWHDDYFTRGFESAWSIAGALVGGFYGAIVGLSWPCFIYLD